VKNPLANAATRLLGVERQAWILYQAILTPTVSDRDAEWLACGEDGGEAAAVFMTALDDVMWCGVEVSMIQELVPPILVFECCSHHL
jgi:hypothetical protein